MEKTLKIIFFIVGCQFCFSRYAEVIFYIFVSIINRATKTVSFIQGLNICINLE